MVMKLHTCRQRHKNNCCHSFTPRTRAKQSVDTLHVHRFSEGLRRMCSFVCVCVALTGTGVSPHECTGFLFGTWNEDKLKRGTQVKNEKKAWRGSSEHWKRQLDHKIIAEMPKSKAVQCFVPSLNSTGVVEKVFCYLRWLAWADLKVISTVCRFKWHQTVSPPWSVSVTTDLLHL